MGRTNHSDQVSKYKVTSWHNRGGQNQVRGHLDTLPVLFLPSEAYLHTVQTRISKYCPLESWKIGYKEQSPFSIPLSTVSKRAETEGKHVNKRAHTGATNASSVPITRKLHCPFPQIPILHSEFSPGATLAKHSTSANKRKSCYLLRNKDFQIIKIVPILVKANTSNGDSYCYIAKVLGRNSIHQAFILKFTTCPSLDLRQGISLCITYWKGPGTFVCQ